MVGSDGAVRGSSETYVIQTTSGSEHRVKELIEKIVGPDLVSDCFIPTFLVRKRYGDEIRLKEKKLTPGYLYVVSPDITSVARALSDVPAFTRLLSQDGRFVPLERADMAWIDRLTRPNERVIPMSTGVIEHDRVIVQSGPLKGLEGWIRKIDRHKCLAYLEVRILGRVKTIGVGLEIVRRTT